MKLLAGVADPVDQIGFHEAVDVLVLVCDHERSVLYVRKDSFEPLDDPGALIGADYALCAEHMRMRDAAPNILSVQALVKSDGIVKGLDGFIGLFGKAAAPKLCHVKHLRVHNLPVRLCFAYGGKALQPVCHCCKQKARKTIWSPALPGKAGKGTRTLDLLITNQLRYRLRYSSMCRLSD